MINILLTTTLFSLMMICFKLFPRYNVNSLHAIVVNYLVAGTCGFFFQNGYQSPLSEGWNSHSVLVGLLFIMVFNTMAISVKEVGLSITTVTSKMSFVIPVICAITLYSEPLTWLKFVGLILAVVAIYLSTIGPNGKLSIPLNFLPLLLFIFFGQGAADSIFNDSKSIIDPSNQSVFFAAIFFSAAIIGGIFGIIQFFRRHTIFHWNSIWWGFLVGIPNFLSLHFFFESLKDPRIASYEAIAITNMLLILMSALIGVLIFREKLNVINAFGLLASLLAIVCISWR